MELITKVTTYKDINKIIVDTYDNSSNILRQYVLAGVESVHIDTMSRMIRNLFTGKSLDAVRRVLSNTAREAEVLLVGSNVNLTEAKRRLQESGDDAVYPIRLATFGITTSHLNPLSLKKSMGNIEKILSGSRHILITNIPSPSVNLESVHKGVDVSSVIGNINDVKLGIDTNGLVVVHGNVNSKALKALCRIDSQSVRLTACNFVRTSYFDDGPSDELTCIASLNLATSPATMLMEEGPLELLESFDTVKDFNLYTGLISPERCLSEHIPYSDGRYTFLPIDEPVPEPEPKDKQKDNVDDVLSDLVNANVDIDKEVTIPSALTICFAPNSYSVSACVGGTVLSNTSLTIPLVYGHGLTYLLKHTDEVLGSIGFMPYANDAGLQPVANVFNEHWKNIRQAILRSVAIFCIERDDSMLRERGMHSKYTIADIPVYLEEDGNLSYTIKDEAIDISLATQNEISNYLK